jgi:hypothetical protein
VSGLEGAGGAPAREPLPSAGALVRTPGWWPVVPAVGFVLGNLASVPLGHPYLGMAGGALAGLAVALLGPPALGWYRRARIGAALRSTRRAGTVGFVEWHRRAGAGAGPYLMIADSPGGPVRWCIPLLARPHLPAAVGAIRIHGALRRGQWAVPRYADRALWPVGPIRHRPLWTSEVVLGPLPGLAPEVPRPAGPAQELPAGATWRPVRLSLKRTAGQVAVVAHELYTGRVLDSGFLPQGVNQGRALEQNGLYARTADRRSLLYGPGWNAVAVLGGDGARAVPVRRLGLAR